MICATRSASAIAVAAPSASTSTGEECCSAAGPNSSATRLRDRGQVHLVRAHLHHVGVELREVEEIGGQLGQPRDLLAHRPDELRPHRRVGLILVEQLDEPAEGEDRRPQLVRGVRDELLPRAVEAREALLHLVEGGRELADLVGALVRDRRREVALGDLLRGLLQPVEALGVRAGGEPSRRQRQDQRDPSGDQDLTPDQGHRVVHVAERRRGDGDPAGMAVDGDRHRDLPGSLPVDLLDRRRDLPARYRQPSRPGSSAGSPCA